MSKRRWALAALLPVWALVAACGPCDGVFGCTVHPRFSVQGTLVEAVSGEAVPGARIDVVITGGATPVTDSMSTVTDEHGFFQVATEVRESGTVVFDVRVSPPHRASYRVTALEAQARTTGGEATDLGHWVSDPYFRVFTELATRVDPTRRLPNVPVRFERVSGPAMSGSRWTDSGFTARTNSYATVVLFDYDAFPDSLAPLVGDLIVPFPGGDSHARVTLHPTQIYYLPPLSRIIPTIGPSAMYRVTAYDSATGLPVAGTKFTFTRTGGRQTVLSTYSDVTDVLGQAILRVMPLGFGDVVGTLTVSPPAPYVGFTRTGVSLTAFDSDSVATLGSFALHAR